MKIQEGGVYKVVNGELVQVKAPPKREPLTLRPGLTYRTAGGQKAFIYHINPKSIEWNVLGSIETEDGTREPRVWRIDGVTKRPYGAYNDLVSEWSEG